MALLDAKNYTKKPVPFIIINILSRGKFLVKCARWGVPRE